MDYDYEIEIDNNVAMTVEQVQTEADRLCFEYSQSIAASKKKEAHREAHSFNCGYVPKSTFWYSVFQAIGDILSIKRI